MVVGELVTAMDVAVIGGGPGGYAAALRAAQLGLETVLLTDGPLGGVCLNAGCIPAKALLARAGGGDAARLVQWKQGIVDRLTGGIKKLLDAGQVDVYRGRAFFTGPHEVRLQMEEGGKRFSFKHAIIATGAAPVRVEGAITDEEALALSEVPGRIAILGENYIACELATLFARLGSRVTLVQQGERLLPEVDAALTRLLPRSLKALGVEVVRGDAPAADVTVACGDRRPNVEGLELQAVGLSPGWLATDRQQRTAVPHILAVGDVTGPPLLAHKALKQGKVAALTAAGKKAQYWPQATPIVAFTEPEIASAGLSEAQAKAAGHDVLVGRFPFGASGRALTLEAAEGFVQVVADRESRMVLGVHAAGRGAAELIGLGALAIEMAATLDDLAEVMFAHPTLSEALMEAADAALGQSVHLGKLV